MSSRACHRFFNPLLRSAAGVALASLLAGVAARADDDRNNRISNDASVSALQRARHDSDAESLSSQRTPKVVPRHQVDDDPTGSIETYQPAGATKTGTNAFFQDLGTNGRTCFTCHQPDQGWTVSARSVQARFSQSDGLDPIFRPVDGAVCPTADVSTLAARTNAYGLLLSNGLIRIGLPILAGSEFSITSVFDPYGCNSDPATGLTSTSSGMVSTYRRPLPSTNLRLLSTVMWDGREGGLLPPLQAPVGQKTLLEDLSQQAIDATLGHAQAFIEPTAAQVAEIVDFEMGISTAQSVDNDAGDLTAAKAHGGAVALSEQPFFVGINDPLGLNPTGASFTSVIFDLYDSWTNLRGSDEREARAAVARGQLVFNTKPINITGVAGLNDALNAASVPGFCGTCHDTPNGGNHSVKAPLNIGVAGAGPDAPPALDTAKLPVFEVQCSVATFLRPAKTKFYVTDIGRAMLSGKCADVGKFKGPILRGLAARAPYFHNGSAGRLIDAVNFYDERFNIGFSDREKRDLVTFLGTL